MLLAAVFSAVFGLLRSAGYCSPSLRRFDPGVHLPYSDLTLDPERGVGICASRRQRQISSGGGGGESVRLCRTGSILSLHRVTPVAWRTLHLRRPVFAFQDGSYLTRARLGHILHAAFHSSCDLNTHSFRIGGASAAGAMGFSSA